MLVVYFSSTTENTHRFVQKLGFPSARIPLRRTEEPLKVNEPYVLVCPTYGGGAGRGAFVFVDQIMGGHAVSLARPAACARGAGEAIVKLGGVGDIR